MLRATLFASLMIIGTLKLNAVPVGNTVQVLCSGCDGIETSVTMRIMWPVLSQQLW